MKNLRFSQKLPIFFGNDTIWGRSYNLLLYILVLLLLLLIGSHGYSILYRVIFHDVEAEPVGLNIFGKVPHVCSYLFDPALELSNGQGNRQGDGHVIGDMSRLSIGRSQRLYILGGLMPTRDNHIHFAR